MFQRVFRRWIGAGLGEGNGIVDFGRDLRFYLIKHRLGDQAVSRQSSGQAHDGIARGPFCFLFFTAVGARVAARMADQAIGLALQ